MSFVGKSYKFQKNENLDDFLSHLGIPAEKVNYLLNAKPTQRIDKDGDGYVLVTIDANTTELKFKDGVEFDETVTDGLVAKTTFNISGDTVTQVQKYDDGRSLTIKRIFKGDELVIELTASSWDGVARRYYTAA